MAWHKNKQIKIRTTKKLAIAWHTHKYIKKVTKKHTAIKCFKK